MAPPPGDAGPAEPEVVVGDVAPEPAPLPAEPAPPSGEDRATISLEDVQAFFDLYYAPNNATLVVVGDFEPAELRRLVTEYFAAIRRSTGL